MLAILATLKDEVRDYMRRGGFRPDGEALGEAQVLRSLAYPEALLVITGVGPRRSQEAARQVIEAYRPRMVVTAGFCGGARPDLAAGDLVVCDRLVGVEGPPAFWRPAHAMSLEPLSAGTVARAVESAQGISQRCIVGPCLSVGELVPSQEMKAWLGEAFAVAAVDMESFWVAQVCQEAGIDCLALRSVLDPVHQTLPLFVAETVANNGRGALRAAAVQLTTRPTTLPTMWRLASQARRARASLCALLSSITEWSTAWSEN